LNALTVNVYLFVVSRDGHHQSLLRLKSDMVPDQTAFLFYPKACIFTFLSKGPKSVQFDLMLVAKKIVNFLEERSMFV